MVGVAVKVTEVPAQILFPGLGDIVTDGTTDGFTVIVPLNVGFTQGPVVVTV